MSQIRHTEREQKARSSGIGPHHPPHVVIIGGGIAGMATAYALQERARAVQLPLTCTLVEASDRLGGAILTERVDGFVIEAGPDSLLTQKPWGVELCQELGIGDRLIGTNDQQRKIYILWQGRLRPLPEGLMLIVPTRLGPLLRSQLLTWPGKIRMGCEYLLPPRAPEGDESLAAFVRRRLGREALERIAAPLLAGIYAGSLDEMSLLATFPRLRELEAQHGGLIRGMLAQRRASIRRVPAPDYPSAALFVTPRQGMGELVEALTPRLAGVTMVRQTMVKSIRPHVLENRASTAYEITGEEAPMLRADAVVLATPAHVSARLVEGFHPELAKALSVIPYVSTATISLAYRRADVAHPLDGFGFLVARDEPCSIIGATWTSTKFPHRAPAGRVLIRCFVGGVASEHLVSFDDAALVQLAREALQRILGITAAPLLSRIYRWEKATPQYQVGHLERVEAMETMLTPYAGLFLTGSAYHGIGVPDCIHHGTQTAERVLAALTASR